MPPAGNKRRKRKGGKEEGRKGAVGKGEREKGSSRKRREREERREKGEKETLNSLSEGLEEFEKALEYMNTLTSFHFLYFLIYNGRLWSTLIFSFRKSGREEICTVLMIKYCLSLLFNGGIVSLEFNISAFGNLLAILDINAVILSHSNPLYINSWSFFGYRSNIIILNYYFLSTHNQYILYLLSLSP